MVNSYAKAKSRKLNYSFFAFPKHVEASKELAALSPYALKLLIHLCGQFTKKSNGETNNGDFCAAWSYMEKRGFKSRATLTKATKELLDVGFIEKTRQGGRNSCNLFAITWLPVDYCGGKLEISAPTKVASNKWKNKSLTQLTSQPSTPAVLIKEKGNQR